VLALALMGKWLVEQIAVALNSYVTAYAQETARIDARIERLETLADEQARLTRTVESVKDEIARSSRWWERQATAYDDIIRSASRLCGYHTECYNNLRSGYVLTDEWTVKAEEKNRDALGVLERFRDSGGFVISTEAQESIRRILGRYDQQYGEYDADYHCRLSRLLLQEVTELKTRACRDLHVAQELSQGGLGIERVALLRQ
jgi:hypothetical protein